jgi:hypothetical protein
VVCAVMGTVAGGPAGRAMLAHWTIMVRGSSQIFAAGPRWWSARSAPSSTRRSWVAPRCGRHRGDDRERRHG